MLAAGGLLERVFIGRALASNHRGEGLRSKKIALPVFASDSPPAVAYAPDKIFITLSVAGLAAYASSWKIGLVVVAVILSGVASYRQNLHACPSGGGDDEATRPHNQPALRLKGRLLFQPGVLVTPVAYQLQSPDRRSDEDDRPSPCDSRKAVDPVATRSGV